MSQQPQTIPPLPHLVPPHLVVVQTLNTNPQTTPTPNPIQNKLIKITSQPLPTLTPALIQQTQPIVQSQPFDFKKYYNSIQTRLWLENACNTWKSFDSDIAFHITQFKRQYVFPIGDVPVRSVLMAVSTGLTYALLGRFNPSLLARARNLGLNFVLNGSFWLPELFNPFLFLQNRQ